ncbi:hypothetical protein HAX54_000240, partial [Datura stramonium]|nr:hypothetical protein [Datura stramonium]
FRVVSIPYSRFSYLEFTDTQVLISTPTYWAHFYLARRPLSWDPLVRQVRGHDGHLRNRRTGPDGCLYTYSLVCIWLVYLHCWRHYVHQAPLDRNLGPSRPSADPRNRLEAQASFLFLTIVPPSSY